MIETELQNRFVELRSSGWSFARIAAELNVSKPTLIKWSRKYQFEIHNLRAIELEAHQEQWLESRENRIRKLGEQLQKAEAELATRSFSDLPTTRLISIVEALRRQLHRETGPLEFTTPANEIPDEEFVEKVHDWKG